MLVLLPTRPVAHDLWLYFILILGVVRVYDRIGPHYLGPLGFPNRMASSWRHYSADVVLAYSFVASDRLDYAPEGCVKLSL